MKAVGHEDGGQHQRDRDEGAAHLVHGAMGRLAGRHPFMQVALDVLDDDDRIVDHDADGEHEAEEGEVVQREAEGAHHGEGADERDRDRHDRDDRGPPSLQEEDDDDDHEQDRLVDRLVHLVHRFGDELGRIVDDLVAPDPCGKSRQSSLMVPCT